MNSSIQFVYSRQICLSGSDSNFGPAIAPECRQLDFTLYFEQIFLSLVPSLFLILLAPIRIATVFRRDIKTLSTPIHTSKIASALVYAALQLALLVFWCLSSTERTQVSIPAAVLSFVCGVFICVLSHFEHVKSVQPSAILNIYLFFSVLFDVVQLRTLWKIPNLSTIASVFSASFSAKATLLVLEAIEKGSFLTSPYRWTAPEALSSVYNSSIFWWLNRLLRTGFRKVIAFDDLYALDPALQSEKLNTRAQAYWEKVNKNIKHPLIKSTVTALKWPFLAPVFPRLCLIGFNYAQPFLINRTVNFINEPATAENKNIGYGLIGATAVTYLGRAVANWRYKHATYRSMTVVRGALVSMIYSKTLKLKISESQDAPAVTLMSTDVAGITTSLDGLHDIWGSFIEVSIGMYLLWYWAGVGFVILFILVPIFIVVNYFVVGKKMVGYRKNWNEATQRRVSLAASALRDMKSLRMMGLGPRLSALLQSQRVRELHRMRGLRQMIILMNVIGSLASLLSPPFILMVYSVKSRANGWHPLEAAQAYSILSVVSLTVEPLSIVLTRIPVTMSSVACFDRIQQYLLREEREDDRLVRRFCNTDSAADSSGIELDILENENKSQQDNIMVIDDLSLGYAKDTEVVHSVSIT